MAKKKKIRKFFKACLLAAAGLTGFVLLAVLAMWLFFPERRVLDFVAGQSAAAGWPVKIQNAAWSPSGRIELRQIAVSFQPDSSSEPIPFFNLERAAVRLRILPLLRRELSVSEVVLEKPDVHLTADFIQKVQAWAAGQPVRKTAPKPLPFELGIESLALRHFRLQTKLSGPSPIREFGIEGLNLDVAKLRIPPQALKTPDGFRGSVKLYSEKGSLSLSMPQGEFRFDPNLDIRMEYGQKGRWSLSARTDLRPEDAPGSSIAGVRVEAEGTGFAGKIRLKESELRVGGETALVLEGEAGLSDSTFGFQLKIEDRSLSLETLKDVFMAVLPDTFRQILGQVTVHGQCGLLSGWINGNPGAYRFKLSSRLRDGSAEVPFARVRMEGGNANLNLEGTGSTAGIRGMHVTGDLTVPLVRSQVNDTVSIDLNQSFLSWVFDVNDAIVPVRGVLTGSIRGLFGGQCSMNTRWEMKARNPVIIDSVALSSEIRLRAVDFSAFPNAPPGIKGKGNMSVDLRVRGEKDILLTVAAEAPNVTYPYSGKVETLPPLRADASMAWHAENSFRKWILDRTDLRLMDLFSADLRGEAVPEKQEFSFALKSGQIRNSSFTQFLPQKLRNEIEGVEFFGRETVEMTVRSSARSGKAAAISLSGKLRFEDAGVSLPLQAVSVNGIRGEVDVRGTPEELSGDGRIRIGEIFFRRMRPEPLTEGDAGFRWHFVKPDRFEILDGRLIMPDLASEILFSAGVDSLSSAPVLKGRADYSFDAADSLRLTPLLVLLGKAKGWATLESAGSGSSIFNLRGEASADSVTIIGKPMVEVRGLRGRIPFALDIDPDKPGLAVPERTGVFPDLSFEKDRDVYKELFPNLSDVTVRTVSVAGYSMDDIQMDVQVQGGMVQVPRFQAKLLGGNLGGSLRLELKDGIPSSMVYFVRADAARINSAVLLKSQVTDEDTELDASMSFSGRGLDPNAGLDVEGALNITKIGPKFAGTMLKGIDPQGTDRSILLTRRLFELGYKPKLFSFEIHHGYVYPNLIIAKPWFIPVKMADRIGYGRLSIEFFMKNMALFTKK